MYILLFNPNRVPKEVNIKTVKHFNIRTGLKNKICTHFAAIFSRENFKEMSR